LIQHTHAAALTSQGTQNLAAAPPPPEPLRPWPISLSGSGSSFGDLAEPLDPVRLGIGTAPDRAGEITHPLVFMPPHQFPPSRPIPSRSVSPRARSSRERCCAPWHPTTSVVTDLHPVDSGIDEKMRAGITRVLEPADISTVFPFPTPPWTANSNKECVLAAAEMAGFSTRVTTPPPSFSGTVPPALIHARGHNCRGHPLRSV